MTEEEFRRIRNKLTQARTELLSMTAEEMPDKLRWLLIEKINETIQRLQQERN